MFFYHFSRFFYFVAENSWIFVLLCAIIKVRDVAQLAERGKWRLEKASNSNSFSCLSARSQVRVLPSPIRECGEIGRRAGFVKQDLTKSFTANSYLTVEEPVFCRFNSCHSHEKDRFLNKTCLFQCNLCLLSQARNDGLGVIANKVKQSRKDV